MRKEALEQIWSAGKRGDLFAITIMGIIYYEGKYVQRNVEEGEACLEHAAQHNLLWARDLVYYIDNRPNSNQDLRRNVVMSSDAVRQMDMYVNKGNPFALTMLGEYFINQHQEPRIQSRGLEYLNSAVLHGCLWAKEILTELGVLSGVTAKANPLTQSNIGPQMRSFLERALNERFGRFNLSILEIQKGVKSACDFFGISYPMMVQDLTNLECGSTMFCNADEQSFSDDILCYDLYQLQRLNVRTYEAFTLVMTHECAHRVFQDYEFTKPNFGQWEHEMVSDYFMGVRSGMQQMDISDVVLGFKDKPGSMTHPTGSLRVKVMMYGKNRADELVRKGYQPTLQGMFKDFLTFRSSIDNEVRHYHGRMYMSLLH